jgi:hypothetical protein
MVIMISIFSKHGPNPDPKQTDKQGHDDHHQQGCDQANPSFRYLLLLLLLLPYSLLVMLFSRSTSDDGRRRRWWFFFVINALGYRFRLRRRGRRSRRGGGVVVQWTTTAKTASFQITSFNTILPKLSVSIRHIAERNVFGRQRRQRQRHHRVALRWLVRRATPWSFCFPRGAGMLHRTPIHPHLFVRRASDPRRTFAKPIYAPAGASDQVQMW